MTEITHDQKFAMRRRLRCNAMGIMLQKRIQRRPHNRATANRSTPLFVQNLVRPERNEGLHSKIALLIVQEGPLNGSIWGSLRLFLWSNAGVPLLSSLTWYPTPSSNSTSSLCIPQLGFQQASKVSPQLAELSSLGISNPDNGSAPYSFNF